MEAWLLLLVLLGVWTNLLGSFKNSSILLVKSWKLGRAVCLSTQPVQRLILDKKIGILRTFGEHFTVISVFLKIPRLYLDADSTSTPH